MQSEPSVPTFRTTVAVDSSPVRMDVDSSPGNYLSSPFTSRPSNHPRSVSDTSFPERPNPSTSSGSSGASDRLADFFSCHDLSPIPNSRKRLLDLENSPTPGSTAECIDSLVLNSAAPRRAFDKPATTASQSQTSNVARRRGSQNTLGAPRRPTLAAAQTTGPSVAINTSAEHKRHAQQLNGKPMTQKSVRRAYSVADAFASSSSDVSMNDQAHRASIATDSYFQTVGRRAGSNVSVDLSMQDGEPRRPPENGSPVAGFRTLEEKGKALPCYRVKDDGLMRIDGETVRSFVYVMSRPETQT